VATLAQLLTALADQIRDSLDDVTDVAVQVEDRMVISPSAPCVDVYPADPSADAQLGAFGDLVGGELITVRARVGTADSDAGQDLLLALMDDEDPLSIVQAINDDRTLGGWAQDTDVRGRSGYTLFPDPGGEGVLLGCLWAVVAIKGQS
jgi:hypothetical protein